MFPIICLRLLIPLVASALLAARMAHGEPPSAIKPAIEAFGLKETNPRIGLPNFIAKAQRGENLRVAYLGGSITNAPGWRVLSLDLLRKKYPKATLHEIHAAISGTGSAFAAFRLQDEVLAHRPDLLFVEFAVNDGGANPERIIRAMEGIVRQTWRANPQTDICFVYTLGIGDLKTLEAGTFQRSASAMERVAEHYGIPSIHFGVEVTRLYKEEKLIFTAPLPKTGEQRAKVDDKIVFAGDAVHPHVETGHPLYLASIERAWPSIVTASKFEAAPRHLTQPLDPLNWEAARTVPIGQIERKGGWQKLPPESPQAKAAGSSLNELWSTAEAGASLSFRFTGRAFGLYGLKGPDTGQFRVTVDDRAPVVAAQFDSHCTTDRWRINPWIYPAELPDGEHQVRIEVLGTTPDKLKILKPGGGTIVDPAQRDAANVHIGKLLILGELQTSRD